MCRSSVRKPGIIWELCEVKDVSAKLIVVNIWLSVHLSRHHIVHLKFM